MLLEVNKHNMMTELVNERVDKMIIDFQDTKLHISILHTPHPTAIALYRQLQQDLGKGPWHLIP